MSGDREFLVSDLHAFLADSKQEEQRLCAIIASDQTPTEEKVDALVELANLTCNLTELAMDVIRNGEQSS